jgi:hypothetical protein
MCASENNVVKYIGLILKWLNVCTNGVQGVERAGTLTLCIRPLELAGPSTDTRFVSLQHFF